MNAQLRGQENGSPPRLRKRGRKERVEARGAPQIIRGRRKKKGLNERSFPKRRVDRR